MPRSTRLALALVGATLALLVPAAGASAATTWLCAPGMAANPCEPGLDVTAFSADGAQRLGVERVRREARPKADCFYVYPTVSDQKAPQATFEVTPELRSIARYHTGQLSQLCRVFAPVYRQITIQGLLQSATVTPEMRETAYADVRDAWREYLREHNRGRGVVLVGHSQGTGVLRRLVAEEIDGRAAMRKRLVSALLLGGGITVKEGSDVGGDFQHVRACREAGQVGCVISYMTFNAPVPEGSRFGRTTEPGLEVLCTNPAALAGGAGVLTPIYSTEPFAPGVIGDLTRAQGALPSARTPWISLRRAFRAECSKADGASVLQVRARDGAPVFPALPEPGWGLHLQDVNIAMTQLLEIVRGQIAAHGQARRPRARAAATPPRTTWLCKPGLRDNPCDYGLRTTVFSPSGERQGVERVRGARDPQVDCFYVYPTVSDQPTLQANLEIGPELRSIAIYQASRYAQHCRVFAPVYRQITLAGLLRPDEVTPAMREQALADVKAAWRDYLRTENDGRGVILMGHSQGTYVLRQLIADEIDRKPEVRRRLVSALLLGGGVTVEEGSDAGGDFRHIRACRRAGQVGCVIAFSTYNAPVDAAIARFGRTTEPGMEILCTNPGALAGGAGDLTPEMPTQPFGGTVIASQVSQISALVPKARTPWISVPRAYRARCTGGAGGANVLAITPRGGAPVFPALPEPGWGLHLADANIALGDLTAIVQSQIAGYQEGRGPKG